MALHFCGRAARKVGVSAESKVNKCEYSLAQIEPHPVRVGAVAARRPNQLIGARNGSTRPILHYRSNGIESQRGRHSSRTAVERNGWLAGWMRHYGRRSESTKAPPESIARLADCSTKQAHPALVAIFVTSTVSSHERRGSRRTKPLLAAAMAGDTQVNLASVQCIGGPFKWHR